MITVRVHKRGRDIVVAACDKDLLGRKLKEGDLRLDVSTDFYGGDEGDEELLLNRLAMATVANLVGEEVCSIAAKNEFIDMEGVIVIEGVPHAQMVRF